MINTWWCHRQCDFTEVSGCSIVSFFSLKFLSNAVLILTVTGVGFQLMKKKCRGRHSMPLTNIEQ